MMEKCEGQGDEPLSIPDHISFVPENNDEIHEVSGN